MSKQSIKLYFNINGAEGDKVDKVLHLFSVEKS